LSKSGRFLYYCKMNFLKKFVKSFFRFPVCESVIIYFSSVPFINRFFFLLRPRHIDYPPNTIRRAERNHIRYELDLSDWVEWNIYFKNKIEPREKLYSLVKKGDVVVDIGVNVGETILNLAARTGNDGIVFGFEANPVVFEKCKKNISLNPSIKNISLQSVALGKEEEEFFLKTHDERNKGMNSLSSSGEGEKISTISFDSFAEKQNLNQINLMKIDVEGFEMNILLGAEKSIRRFHPVLFIEVDDEMLKRQHASAKELISWLIQHNYKIFDAETDIAVTVAQSFNNCHFDIICLTD